MIEEAMSAPGQRLHGQVDDSRVRARAREEVDDAAFTQDLDERRLVVVHDLGHAESELHAVDHRLERHVSP
jgi:hypothetical protein